MFCYSFAFAGVHDAARRGWTKLELMTTSALYFTIINSWVCFSFYMKHSPGTAVNSCKGMIHQDEISWILDLEFNHDRSACRHQCGLQTLRRWAHQITFAINPVKYFTNDMET